VILHSSFAFIASVVIKPTDRRELRNTFPAGRLLLTALSLRR
jgi:hypothetical protein